MKTGEALARTLRDHGIRVVYGIPGVHTLEYYRGFAAAGIRTVAARHEGGAAFMADGHARASGEPAACCVITGPGLTNASTGIGQARSDSVPMVVLASTTPATSAGRGWGLLHELQRQLDVLAQVTKAARHADDPRDAVLSLRALLGELGEGRPRPVGLEVPTDVLRAVLADDALDGLAEVPAAAPAPDPPAVEVEAVLGRLREARRPVLVLGGGTRWSPAGQTALAERFGLPVLTTTAGIGVVPAGHELLAGALLSRPAAHAWLAERDLVLLLGTELSETDTVTPVELGGPVVHVDIDDEVLRGPYGADVAVRADAGAFARALLAAAGPEDGPGAGAAARDRGEAVAEVAALRPAAARPLGDGEAELIAIVDTIRASIPPAARVFADMTQLAYVGCWRFTADRPGRFLFPAGFGSLGYAVPAAIGGAVADPSARSYAVVGDGGLLYTASELMTATELDLELTVILWDNDALGQIREDMVAAGIPPTSVDLQNPDFDLLARSHGFTYRRPEDLAGLSDLLAAPPARRTFVHLRPGLA
ncbi:MAG: decarboxylase [Actinobacteria bacterium]|nr:decarboxylase [Actinomycetota bacterium]